MRRPASYAISIVAAGLLMLPAADASAQAQIPTPDRYEADIAAFEAADRKSPPPKGEIVFIGSSTIRLWDTAAAFPDLKIVNRGFGGSWLSEAVRYAERIVTPYEPRLVVLYAGDNDIAQGWTSEQVAIEFERFVRVVHAKLPQSKILYVAIKPSILRWQQDHRMQLANDLIRAVCDKDDRLGFLDIGAVMLGYDEKPRPELYVADGLHMTAEGYRIWNAVIRPFLLPAAPPTLTSR
jgi:lysophospholipase L1-like esterase